MDIWDVSNFDHCEESCYKPTRSVLCVDTSSFLWDKYQTVGWRGHRVGVYLTWETDRSAYCLYHFTFQPATRESSSSLHILLKTWYGLLFFFSLLVIAVGVCWFLIVVLICFSLRMNDIFVFTGHSYILFYEVHVQIFSPFLDWISFVLTELCVVFFFIFIFYLFTYLFF